MIDPDRLLDRYLDGTLSSEAFAELEQGLCDHPEYADLFASAMLIDVVLKAKYERDEIASCLRLQDGGILTAHDLEALVDDYDQAEVPIVDLDHAARVTALKAAASKPKTDPDALHGSELLPAAGYVLRQGSLRLIRSKAGLLVGLAALLALMLWLVNPFTGPQSTDEQAAGTARETTTPPGDPFSAVVATLTAERDAVWDRRPGQDLYAGQRFVLTQGFAEITTSRGAVAVLEAPTTIELLDNDNAIYLHTGKLFGLCHTESSKGFVVRTPHAEITDIGTRFGVEVVGDRIVATVFSGEIIVRDANEAAYSLTEEQTVRLDPIRGNEVIIEDRVATGFESLRLLARDSLLSLPNTGSGLAVGQADPNWSCVAVNGKALDRPARLTARNVRRFNVPVAGLKWASIEVDTLPENDAPQPIYTLQTALLIPAGKDPSTVHVSVEYAVDDKIAAIRVNGEPVTIRDYVQLSENRLAKQVIDVPFKAGRNLIEFDVIDTTGAQANSYVGVFARWTVTQAPVINKSPTEELNE